MAAIALFGIISCRALPVADLPTVDYPTVNVGAALPGGDPATMASTVASPLERQFTTIAGVDEMTSSSGAGNSNITLTFDLDRNIDSAVVDVQTAISAAMPLLPSTLTAPPSFRKQNPADMPILMLNLTSNTMEMSAVDEYAENILAPRISMVDGVSQVNVQGAQKYAVRVQLDPNRLRTERIGLNEVDQSLQSWNVNQPTGQLFGSQSTYTINANGLLRSPNGLLRSAEVFRPIVVAYRQGRPIRLDQVANVIDSIETTTQGAWLYTKNGRQRAITLMVQKQPGTNVIEVTDAVRAILPGLVAQLPPAVHLSVRLDRSKTIRAAFHDISITMTTSLAAVFIPILFMAGILGRLFREFAVTITTAILISGVVSITLTPMLCSRFLKVVHSKKGFAGLMDRSFDAMRNGYAWSLGLVLRHRLVMLVVFIAVLWGTVHMFGVVPKGFIPDSDNDSLNVNIRAAQGTSFYDMVKYVERVADVINQNPYVDAMMVNTGGMGGFGGGMNQGRMDIQLTPRASRPLTASQIAQQLRGPLGRYPGFRAFVNVPAALQIGGFRGNSNYNVMVESLNTDELYTWAPRLEQAVSELPDVQEVSTNLEAKSPRVDLVIDRDKAAAVGLNATTIAKI